MDWAMDLMPAVASTWKRKKVVAVLLSVCLLAGLTSYGYIRRSKPMSMAMYHMMADPMSENQELMSTCVSPPQGYKAWSEGVITPIQPKVEKSCSKLIAGDKEESQKVKKAVEGWKSRVSYNQLLELSIDCSRLIDSFRANLYISKVERAFPIAFSFVVYDNLEQFLRLLRLLYRPGNVYCIHPDKKSEYYQFFANIAHCFPNIIIARERVEVSWGAKSLLTAQMHCLADLDSYRMKQSKEKKWQYVVNLCGKELPLISVKEMVEKMSRMNTTSSIVGWPIPKSESWTMRRLRGKKLPYNLTYHKSMTYNALSVQFADFLLHNSTAKKLYNFFMDTDFPEEHFYATLFSMPGVPGGYDPNIPEEGYFEVGHYFWRTNQEEVKLPCYGETVHGICVVNFQDLPRIMEETQSGKTALFHNKYFMELDHVIMDCMEERIVAKNKREFKSDCPNTFKMKYI